MMIERAIPTSKVSPTDAEIKLDKLRTHLESLNKYGLSGPGSPDIRFRLGSAIADLKMELLSSGLYKEVDPGSHAAWDNKRRRAV